MPDIAIVGGGPAGCLCASLLARDRDVTVFEEHRTAGLPMQCAGLVTDETLKMSGVTPDILSTFYGAEVFLPDGNSLVVRSDKPIAHAIDRTDFDSKLMDLAIGAGAEYRAEERVESVRVSDLAHIDTNKGRYESELVIGADGFHSVTASVIPESDNITLLRGIQANVRSVDCPEELFRIHLGSRYAPGLFAWEIPCGDYVRVGLCSSWEAGPPNAYLKRLLDDLGFRDRVLSLNSGAVPVSRRKRMSWNRTMLIGDAAGQVKPVSAGGLYYGMGSAPILTEVALNALNANDLSEKRLGAYDRTWNKTFGPELKKAERIRRAFIRMDDEDLSRAGRYASKPKVAEILGNMNIDRPTDVMRRIIVHPGIAASGFWTLLRCMI